MARGEVQEATIGELAAALTTQAHAYLAEWADMENLAALGPARRLRAELDRRHYRPHRRACLLGEGRAPSSTPRCTPPTSPWPSPAPHPARPGRRCR
ncbi:hypothetical protein ACFQXA_15565 [Nocardiopsis composta]